MEKVAFTLIYILLISIAVNITHVQGKTEASSVTISPAESNEQFTEKNTLPMILASGSVKALPDPATYSLFGFGFLLIVGFGWIKKAADHE